MLLSGWWDRMSRDVRLSILRLAIHLVILAGLGVGAWFGLEAARRYVHGLARYQGPVSVVLRVRPRGGMAMVAIKDLPAARIPKDALVIYRKSDSLEQYQVEYAGNKLWVSPDDVTVQWLTRYPHVRESVMAAAVEHVASATARPNPSGPDWFDNAMAGRIRSGVESNPYVEKVIQVDKQLVGPAGSAAPFERQVVVTVALRKPLAQLWYPLSGAGASYAYVLDEKGWVLERRTSAAAELPYVVGFDPPAGQGNELPVGKQMNAADVLAGLQLLARLSNQEYYGQISRVNVENYNRRRQPRHSELVLGTYGTESLRQQEIGWGARLDVPASWEYNSTDDKLKILQKVLTDYGKLNLMDRMPSGPYNLWQQKGVPRWEANDG